MQRKEKKVLRVHPAPPTALTQEIPTIDVPHTFDAPRGNRPLTDTHDGVFSDVLGSYTGTPADGGTPVQDADDL